MDSYYPLQFHINEKVNTLCMFTPERCHKNACHSRKMKKRQMLC